MTQPMTKRQAVARAALAGCAVAAAAAAASRRAPVLGLVVASAGALAARAAFSPTARPFGQVVRQGPDDRPRASLTFDDGPGPSTAAVLDALAIAGARSTFFVLGRQADRHPDLVRRLAEEGHEVASHGYDHGILVWRGIRHVDDQLVRTEEAVRRAGVAMSPLFRAPHGFRGPATAFAAERRGYRMAAWTAGVFDSSLPGAQVIADRAASALTPGAVILLHDADGWDPAAGRQQTAEAIPAIARAARERGIDLVPLGELLDDRS